MALKENDLLALKEEIEERKNEVAELVGQKKALLTSLGEEWDCSDLEQAIKKVEQTKEKLELLKNTLEKGLKTLEETYFDK